MIQLTSVRAGERSRYKRCPKAWYWAWRKGLVPRAHRFGALELGTWMHAALANWYMLPGKKRGGKDHPPLWLLFEPVAQSAIVWAKEDGAPDHLIEKAEELAELGRAMAHAYEEEYGSDPDVEVITAEIPLDFTLQMELNPKTGAWEPSAVHRLKPDLVYADPAGDIWLMEHKTAKSIRTEYLAINGQGRPYAAMAERALRKAGVLSKSDTVKGVMYNFLRKALPDQRAENDKGEKLNKDGSVSKSQPAALFQRYPLVLTRKQKMITLQRIVNETVEIQQVTTALKTGKLSHEDLKKTDHWSCPRTCEFWRMCVAEESGADISIMESTMYFRRNPYEYEEDTTDELISFEMG